MRFKFFISTLRFLDKNRIFTLINVSGLTIGFACAILIFLHVKKEHSFNKSIPDHERVFNLLQKSSESPLGSNTISYALAPLLANKYAEIETIARTENFSNFSNCIVSYSANDKFVSFNERSFYAADSSLFSIIKYPFIEGKRESAFNSPNSIVLSDETSKRFFGDESALGKNLVLNGTKNYTVSGVVEIPDYVTFDFSMVAPIKSVRTDQKLSSWNSNGRSFIKLHEGTDYKLFNTKIEYFLKELKPEAIRQPDRLTLALLPINAMRLYYNPNPLYLLIFIGIVVLLVSVLNYVNMFTSLTQKRKSEIALKKISGASRTILGKQFMQETFIICLFALLIGVVVTILGIPTFYKITGSDLLPFLKDNIMLFVISSIVLWFIISILSGFYPALLLSRAKPLNLMGKNQRSRSNTIRKSVLITTQFMVSILLIIITLMVDRQYKYMAEMPLGFDNKFVMQLPLTAKMKSNFRNLKNSLKENPNIKDVCIASAMPAGIPNHSGVSWIDDKGEKRDESFGFAIVSDGYTQTFDMKMALGNEFTFEHPEELKGVIINEAAARHLGYEHAVGKQLSFWGKQSTIIGVVKDFQNNFLFNQVKPMIISAHPENQGFTKFIYVSLMYGNINETIKDIEKQMKQLSPNYPFEYSFTDVEVENYINEVRQISSSLSFTSIVSILLATIGLMALTYHTTQSRIKEIGIRKVNGAKSIEVLLMLNLVFFKWIAIAFTIASPLAWFVVFNLQKDIAHKASIVWWVFAIAGLSVAALALLTVSFQSWKAANRNPVEALRYE